MTALTTLNGVPVGTDLGIVVAGETQHWVVRDGGVARSDDMSVVPVELLSGYLAEGLVFLRDFRPPERHEWWASRDGETAVVLRIDGQTVRLASFYRGEFTEFIERSIDYVTGRMERCDVPQIRPGTVISLLATISRLSDEVEKARDAATRLRRLESDITGIGTFLDRARSRITH